MKLTAFKTHGLFLFILALCVILRFLPFFEYQFTLDELSGLERTDFQSFGDLIEKGVKIDAHPALIQVFIFSLVKLFGYANWIIKLPFLLMSLGAIIYSYLFASRNFSQQAGIFSSLILSFSLIFVFYAPIARMYTAGVFFSSALLFYFFEIFFLKRNTNSNYIFLGLFALLSALNQHLNGLFAFTLCASGLLWINKENARPYVLTCLAVLLCYLPHLPVTLYQLGIGGIGLEQNGWLPKPEIGALFSFLKILLGTGHTYVLFIVFTALAFFLNKKVQFSKGQLFLLVLFITNYAVIYFYSIFRASIFQNSALLFSSVAFVAFMASLLQYKNTYVYYGTAAALCACLLFKTYVRKNYFHEAVQTVFEYQFARTVHYKQLYGDRAVYPIFFDADTFMSKLYQKKYATRFDCKVSSDSVTFSTRAFTHFVAALKADYLVLASSMPDHQAVVADYFPYLIENTQTQGIHYKVYSKRPADRSLSVMNDPVIRHSDLAAHGNFYYDKINNQIIPPASFFFPVDRASEFPFDARANYGDLISSPGEVLLVKTRMKALGLPFSGKLATCISVTDDSLHQTFNYSAKDAGDFVPGPDSTLTVYVSNFIGTSHRQVNEHTNMNVYLWNKGKDRFALMDFEINLIDHWHSKWHFWD